MIPARGGSKRIPRKNIRFFLGKPMIVWSIEAAIASGCFDKVVVSTDDADIASIALKSGAEVPFLRPDSLSDDYTSSTAVVRHAVSWLLSAGWSIDMACCIYATAPFLTAHVIQDVYRALMDSQKSYAFTVVSYDYPVQRAIKLGNHGEVEMLYPEYQNVRSQDLVECCHDAGQVYWGRVHAWLNDIPIFSSHSTPVFIPRYLALDIDTEEDWQHAELMYKLIMEQS